MAETKDYSGSSISKRKRSRFKYRWQRRKSRGWRKEEEKEPNLI